MTYSFALPFLMGFLGVLQNTLNRRFADSFGLPFALIVNSLVLFLISIVFYLYLRILPSERLSESLQISDRWRDLSWQNFLPGIFGFVIILVLPLCLEKAGATKVFVAIVAAQIICSVFWDYFFESIEIGMSRILGAALAILGAVLASK